MLTWAIIATVLALAALGGVVWLVLQHYRVRGSIADVGRSVSDIARRVNERAPRPERIDPNA